MVAEVVQSLKATIAEDLWTWSGVYFGYRRRDSLFTHDGIEVGRFAGLEAYGSVSANWAVVRATRTDDIQEKELL